jgi:predicted MFS family arabinose efflux permease
VSSDARRILVAQTLRAVAYGFVSVFLGLVMEARGWSTVQVGLLLTSIVGGTAIMSVLVGTFGDRIGRRRTYAALFLGLVVAGVAFGLSTEVWLLVAVALTGTLSTEVVESGPFTSLEQAMLPRTVEPHLRNRIFGRYNAVATIAGSVGALAAGGPELLRETGIWLPPDHAFFLLLVPVGLAGSAVARSLSAGVEAAGESRGRGVPLRRSRGRVVRLSGLFAVDSFAGGFVVQSFIAFWFRRRFGVSPEILGLVFFGVGLLQAASFLAATRLADRIGLLPTMVFTHLPSNLLLAAIPLAPNLPIAVALLLGRFALSQMDVPTRQAYIVALVDPEERTAAAGYTNTARTLARPAGPALGGLVQQVSLGLPFFLAGGIKAAYDLALWLWFRRVPLPDHEERFEGVPSRHRGSRGDEPAVEKRIHPIPDEGRTLK